MKFDPRLATELESSTAKLGDYTNKRNTIRVPLIPPDLKKRLSDWHIGGLRVFPKYGPYTPTASIDGIRWRWQYFLPWNSAIAVHRVRILFWNFFFVRLSPETKKPWLRERFIPIKRDRAKAFFDDILKFSPSDSPFRRCLELGTLETRELRRSKLAWFSVCLFAFYVSSPFLLYIPVHRMEMESFNKWSPAKDAEKVWPDFQKDRTVLEQIPFFTQLRTHSKDAGEILNGALPEYQEKTHVPPRRLALPDDLVDELGKHNGDWRKWSLDWKKHNLDFKWMKDLLAYDYWDSDAGRSRKSLELEGNLDEHRLFHQIALLGYWAHIRLLKSTRDGDQRKAIREVLHLADLLWTSETTNALQEAIHLQSLVNAFATDQHLDYKGIPAQALDVAHRYFYTQGAYLDPRVPIELVKRAIDTKVGVCALAREGIANALVFRDFMSDYFPAYLAEIGSFVRKTSSDCRDDFWRQIWNEPGFSLKKQFQESVAEVAKAKHQWTAYFALKIVGVPSTGPMMAALPHYSFSSYTDPPARCPKK